MLVQGTRGGHIVATWQMRSIDLWALRSSDVGYHYHYCSILFLLLNVCLTLNVCLCLVVEFNFIMRPPSLIAAACICSAVNGLTDQMCNRIIKKLHKVTAIDEVRSSEVLLRGCFGLILY